MNDLFQLIKVVTDLREDHEDDEDDAAYGDDGAGGGGLREILGDLAVDVQSLDVHHHSEIWAGGVCFLLLCSRLMRAAPVRIQASAIHHATC